MIIDSFEIRLLLTIDCDNYFNLVDKNRHRLEDFFVGTTSRTGSLDSTKEFIHDMLKRNDEKMYYPYIIIDSTTNQLIGFIDLKNIDWSIPKSEMGFYIDEAYSGKGLMTKLFNAFCEWINVELKFNKLYFRTHESNIGAQKIAERCGFEKEGLLRRDYKSTDGKLVDLIYFGKLYNHEHQAN